MLILEKMLVFLILMLVGLLLAKVRILDEPSSRKLSAVVLYVANPALIIGSSQTGHVIPGAQLLTALADRRGDVRSADCRLPPYCRKYCLASNGTRAVHMR